MDLAPVLLFVYNRPSHTAETIKNLQNNYLASQSSLFVFIDGSKNEEDNKKVEEVDAIVSGITGFKSIKVFKSKENKGLAKSVILGVDKLIEEFGKVIVLEDDLLTSKNFLTFMNQSLNHYEDNKEVFSVSGFGLRIKIPENYLFDTYLIPYRSSSWGWGTWKYVWDDIDWNIKDYSIFRSNREEKYKFNSMGKDMLRMLDRQLAGSIDSWSIRFDYHLFKNKAYCVYPVKSKVLNAGFDNSGTHTKKNDYFKVELDNSDSIIYKFQNQRDDEIISLAQKYFQKPNSFSYKLFHKLKQIVKLDN